jgi:hypothetical protein
MDKYENDVHNCTNPQIADMLENLANLWSFHPREELEILVEAAKRLRTKQRELFNSEQFNL